MSLSSETARILGKLLRNIKDPQWYAAQAGETAIQMCFMSPLGHIASAYLKAHLFDGDKKIGEVYECKYGHQYVKSVDGKKYALHPETEDWHQG